MSSSSASKTSNFFWDWDLDSILCPATCVDAPHAGFRDQVARFRRTHIDPFVSKWDVEQDYDKKQLLQQAVKAGIYGALWPKSLGGAPPVGSVAEGDNDSAADIYYDFILNDELSVCASGGCIASTFVSLAIGLPPVLKTKGCQGGPELTKRIATEAITGKKTIALAVTEPYGGSDVASVRTKAVKSSKGDYYSISGEKAFITGGLSANYLTLAALTNVGLSLFLVDASLPGIQRIRTTTQVFKMPYVYVVHIIGLALFRDHSDYAG